MKKLQQLIRGQDVAFDTHQSGDGQPVKVRDLHLEKRLHNGGKIRFPFFGDAEPSASEGVSDKVFARVVREVKKALRDNGRLREQLAETIASQLDRFANGLASIENAGEAARKIAGAFDLGEDFVSTVVIHANNRLISFRTLHLGRRPGTFKEIVQDAQKVAVQRPKESWEIWRRRFP